MLSENAIKFYNKLIDNKSDQREKGLIEKIKVAIEKNIRSNRSFYVPVTDDEVEIFNEVYLEPGESGCRLYDSGIVGALSDEVLYMQPGLYQARDCSIVLMISVQDS